MLSACYFLHNNIVIHPDNLSVKFFMPLHWYYVGKSIISSFNEILYPHYIMIP